MFALFRVSYNLVLYKLETQIPTFEHCSCLNDFVFRQNAKVRRYQVSTSTFLKSQYGDAIEDVFVLFQNVAGDGIDTEIGKCMTNCTKALPL